MPSIYTHYRYGNEVLNKLSPEDKNIVLNNIDEYILGLQGPDFLFFDTLSKKKTSELGSKMHLMSFNEVLDNFVFTNKNFEMSYLYGFLTHFILDSYIHPVIKNYTDDGEDHFEIETELDRYYMNLDNKDFSSFRLSSISPYNKNLSENIYSLYRNFSDKDSIDSSIKGMKRIKSLLRCNNSFKYGFIKFVMKRLGQWDKFKHIIYYGEKKERLIPIVDELVMLYDDAINDFDLHFYNLKKYLNDGIKCEYFENDFE